jgi:hypothetical protein
MNSNEPPNISPAPSEPNESNELDVPNEADTSGEAAPAPIVSKLPLLAAAAHGFFFLVMGLWPVVSLRTFEAVSGPKTDHWLVITVGWLIAIIGAALLLAAVRRNVGLEMFTLGIGAALALAGVDVVFVIKRMISPVYLLDVVAEALFITLWVFAAKARRARTTI